MPYRSNKPSDNKTQLHYHDNAQRPSEQKQVAKIPSIFLPRAPIADMVADNCPASAPFRIDSEG